eukprot:4941678-Prymnesium_polylepis.1
MRSLSWRDHSRQTGGGSVPSRPVKQSVPGAEGLWRLCYTCGSMPDVLAAQSYFFCRLGRGPAALGGSSDAPVAPAEDARGPPGRGAAGTVTLAEGMVTSAVETPSERAGG